MFIKAKHEDGQQTAFDENSELKLCTEGSVVFGSSGPTKMLVGTGACKNKNWKFSTKRRV